jgi:hypothetical protein
MLQPREAVLFRIPAAERPDPIVALSVLLLSLADLGLLLGGVLAVYDWTTPNAEKPLFFAVLGVFLAALGIQVLAAGSRHLRRALGGGRPGSSPFLS